MRDGQAGLLRVRHLQASQVPGFLHRLRRPQRQRVGGRIARSFDWNGRRSCSRRPSGRREVPVVPREPVRRLPYLIVCDNSTTPAPAPSASQVRSFTLKWLFGFRESWISRPTPKAAVTPIAPATADRWFTLAACNALYETLAMNADMKKCLILSIPNQLSRTTAVWA